jgi:hypothetical protein
MGRRRVPRPLRRDLSGGSSGVLRMTGRGRLRDVIPRRGTASFTVRQ